MSGSRSRRVLVAMSGGDPSAWQIPPKKKVQEQVRVSQTKPDDPLMWVNAATTSAAQKTAMFGGHRLRGSTRVISEGTSSCRQTLVASADAATETGKLIVDRSCHCSAPPALSCC
jgi:hypothetical protein